MIKIQVEQSLLDYASKPDIKFDIDQTLNGAIGDFGILPFSKIILKEGHPTIPYAMYNPEDSSLEIFIFRRMFYPHYGKKNRDYLLFYIFQHEIKEAILRKPSKAYEIVNQTFTYFLPDNMTQRLEYSDESLVLHCKNVCSDAVVDKEITSKNKNSARGFLIAHNLGWGMDKNLINNLDKSENIYEFIFMILSLTRRAMIGKRLKGLYKKSEYQTYASKYIVQFHKITDKLDTTSRQCVFNILSELGKENPDWREVYYDCKQIKGFYDLN